MKKTDGRHYNRREKRLLALNAFYFCAYKDKQTKYGIVEDVIYSGNTVYGRVYLLIGNKWYAVMTDKYKPALKDELHLIPCPPPERNEF